jgi:hypothetical protein
MARTLNYHCLRRHCATASGAIGATTTTTTTTTGTLTGERAVVTGSASDIAAPTPTTPTGGSCAVRACSMKLALALVHTFHPVLGLSCM